MANRNAIHILKNTLFPSQALPSSAYLGEPLVNLGDGIMFFSGGTSGSPTWVPSNNNPAYFEVGSNLYDLKIRNQITHYNGLNNLSGLFLSGTTNGFVLANISSIQGISTDTYVTGFTYNNANIVTLSQNNGQADKTIDIGTLASITVNGNATVTGTTTTENLIVNNPSGTTATIGQGGLIIGSGGSPSNPGIGDLLVHGNFYVYGSGTTIATNELYIEDPTITLNYNPSGSSTSTSVGSGIIIQDGSGIIGTNSELLIGQLYLNGNINSNSEYTSAFGNANRGFYTQLNDIIIRNTNNLSSAPNGKRLIAEDDILDGGSY
jgi:hypothetical protein